jgi:hypothetical protein
VRKSKRKLKPARPKPARKQKAAEPTPTHVLRYTPTEAERRQAEAVRKQVEQLEPGRRLIDQILYWRDFGCRQSPSKPVPQPDKPEPTPVRESKPPRSKPGPRPNMDWPTYVENAVKELIRSGKPIPTAAYFCQLCEDELGYQPDIRQMQRLLRSLRA